MCVRARVAPHAAFGGGPDGLGGGGGGGGGRSRHLDHTGGGSDGVVAIGHGGRGSDHARRCSVVSIGHDNGCSVGHPIGDGGVVSRVGSGVEAADMDGVMG